MSATPKQVALIEDLFNRKAIPEPIREQTRALYTRADQRPVPHIRDLIDGMFALPDAPAAAAPRRGETVDALIRRLEVPKSMFAIPTTLLSPTTAPLAHQNALLFVQVAEYRETRYIRVLRGAPGSFNREKPAPAEARELVNILAKDPQTFAQTFGIHYSCCGSCGAELTDDYSRSIKLGPECRKKFGL